MTVMASPWSLPGEGTGRGSDGAVIWQCPSVWLTSFSIMTLFFIIWISSFSNIIFCRNYPMSIVFLVLWQVFSSVQFSRSVVSNSLRPHESQHASPPCSSSTPGVHSNSRPSSRWCHPAIPSSVIPFCRQSLPSSESFPMSQLFTWGGQSIRVSALASVLPLVSYNFLCTVFSSP